jgi:hypothetical protein
MPPRLAMLVCCRDCMRASWLWGAVGDCFWVGPGDGTVVIRGCRWADGALTGAACWEGLARPALAYWCQVAA